MSVAEPAPPQQTVASRGQALGQLGEPVRRFMRTEAGSAGLLLAATVVALGWANLSPDGYSSFWGTDLALRLGDAELVLDLQHWVNDGLMVFFFFVVGLEVKRELAMGELTDRRRATIPLVAAVAGLAVPALVFLAFNPTGEAAVAPDDLLAHAGALGLDVERFEGDLRDGLHVVRVRDDTLGAEASGVRGTPTFFVGGRRHTAPTDAATLGRALDAMAAGEER